MEVTLGTVACQVFAQILSELIASLQNEVRLVPSPRSTLELIRCISIVPLSQGHQRPHDQLRKPVVRHGHAHAGEATTRRLGLFPAAPESREAGLNSRNPGPLSSSLTGSFGTIECTPILRS